MKQETKNCVNCSKDFTIESEDFNFYEKVDVPPPTFCPDCRLQRRFSFRNDRTLFKRKCDLCKADIISIYHEKSPRVIYCQKCWWSDGWDPMEYEQEYDFSRPFFEQLDDFWKKVPVMANFVVDESRMVNSPYNNMVLDLKNCYLLSNADFNEDCSYGCELENSKHCVDTNLADHCELCYEIINCQKCYKVMWSEDCDSCNDVRFSKDLRGCQNCFGCWGLRNKKYHIFNEEYSKEEYEKKIKQFSLHSYLNTEKHKEKTRGLWLRGLHKYMHEKQNDDVSGDYVYNSKNAHNSWILYEGKDVKYLQYQVAPPTEDTYDVSQFGGGTELSYECLQAGVGVSRIRFGWFVLNDCKDIDYSTQIMGSSDIFGCVGLRKKQYCILNKQYSETEFKELRAKIVDHMNTNPYKNKAGIEYKYGEYFPSSLSPFAYNETTAQEYFPLKPEELISLGYKEWREPEEKKHKITMEAEDLVDSIDGVEDPVLNEVIGCLHAGECGHACTNAFKLIPSELQFYKQIRIPLPRLCPSCRHGERMALRNPPRTWERQCMCNNDELKGKYQNTATHFHGEKSCPNEFKTSYSPDRPEIVYCKECYEAEIA